MPPKGRYQPAAGLLALASEGLPLNFSRLACRIGSRCYGFSETASTIRHFTNVKTRGAPKHRSKPLPDIRLNLTWEQFSRCIPRSGKKLLGIAFFEKDRHV